MSILPHIAVTIASLYASTAALGTELRGKWVLYIENPAHHLVTTASIVFTEKAAASCTSGEWKVVKVLSATTEERAFFPVTEPLSYRIENDQITIGRNQVCDAYLWLQAKLGDTTVQGSYFSLGLGGSSARGYFKLSRAH